jgi:uncharacterized GH25 family protein
MLRKLLIFGLLLLIAASVQAHDLFLRLDSYILPPNSSAVVRLLNGTFQKSEGLIARERMRDISLRAPDLRKPIADSLKWRNQGETTIMDLQTGGPGTYVVGISTIPREISLKAADFNDYLAHDGLPDILAARTKSDELNFDVRERYSKHVRAIFQVGEVLSDDYKSPLDYPVELIPQQNPYSLKRGQTLSVLCMLDGQPLGNQFVIAGWEGANGRIRTVETRSNLSGIAQFKLAETGKWFVKFIHMKPVTDPGLNYESKWATLTFELREKRKR